jgi:hypothetical protein
MAENQPKPWGKISLLEDEDIEFEVQKEEVRGVVARGQLCVVGKLVSDRIVSKETIKTEMLRWWKISENTTFKILGDNLFLIVLDHVRDKARILEGGPWVFEGSLFLVKDFDGRIAPSNLNFDRVSFWIRMLELPLACMGRQVGLRLGSSVGTVDEIDTDKEGIGWGEFLRVKISLDISKPLLRGRKLKYEGESYWIVFQYENYLNFAINVVLSDMGRRDVRRGAI